MGTGQIAPLFYNSSVFRLSNPIFAPLHTAGTLFTACIDLLVLDGLLGWRSIDLEAQFHDCFSLL